ncbi:MAG: hypothetical protein JO264_06080 [Acidisphaera sp.]|nr:hypothetical protein [Acidisphaera sp.]
MTVLNFPTPHRARSEDAAGGGLSDNDCFAIAAAASRLPGGWLAQRDEDARGHASMMLFPAVADGEILADTPTLIIWRVGEELQVVLGRVSGLIKLGSCRRAEEAMRLAGAALAAASMRGETACWAE